MAPASYFTAPIRMKAHFTPRPWGGRKLETILGKPLPPGDEPIGESWELSAHPNGQSLVDAPGTELDGMVFGEALARYPQEMIGDVQAPERYPLLVKFIDASGDLSVQVHPDDAWCARNHHPDRGKTECWYIMDCPPDAKLIHGYQAGVTEEQARAALEAGNLEELLQYKKVEPGSFVSVPAGTVHAITSGLVVCEIQQSSDTTFRLYDWNRQPPRELHVDQSMEVTEWDAGKVPPIQGFGAIHEGLDQEIIQNEFFMVTMIDARKAIPFSVDCPAGMILNVVGGSGELRFPGAEPVHLKIGATFFLPAAMDGLQGVVAPDAEGIRMLVTKSKEIG